MVDLQSTVCSMCGDVGFPDKLFRCINCHNRFQHSYCSNYYTEASEPIQVCDWCQSEQRSTTRHGGQHGGHSSRKSMGSSSSSSYDVGISKRSEYSSHEKIKQHDREEAGTERGKNSSGGAPSPRQATRRYKLLKDVMC